MKTNLVSLFQESFSSNAGSLESSATAGISENSMAGGLPQGTLYHLHVCLRTGRDLVARDSGGTSDPYVKFYWRNKQVYKSKTIDKELNPVWDESFILAIDDPFVPLELKVLNNKEKFPESFWFIRNFLTKRRNELEWDEKTVQ